MNPDRDLEDLDADALSVLGALALSTRPPSTDAVVSFLDRAGVDTAAGRRFAAEATKKLLFGLRDTGWTDLEIHSSSRAWTLTPLVREEVLFHLLQQRPADLGALASAEIADEHWWTSPLQDLLLALAAGDAGLGRRVWKELLGGDAPLSGEDLTLVGLILGLAARNGAWSRFSVAEKLWLIGVRTLGSVQFGLPPRDLPALLGPLAPEPQVRAALGDWEAVSRLAAGDLVRVRALVEAGPATPTLRGVAVLVLWLTGDEAGALGALDGLLADRARQSGAKQEWFVPGVLFPFLACLALGRDRAPVSKVKSWASEFAPEWSTTASVLWSLFRHRGKADSLALVQKDVDKVGPLSVLDGLLLELGTGWLGADWKGRAPRQALGLADLFAVQGARWYELEHLRSVARRAGTEGPWTHREAELRPLTGVSVCLADLVGHQASWEAALDRLADLKFDKAAVAKGENPEVLCWVIDPVMAAVEPVLRKPLKGGGWSAPKRAPLTRIGKGDHPAITPEDRPALRALKNDYYGWEFDHKRALEALAGHPRLFLSEQDDTPFTLEASEVELRVDEGAKGLTFAFSSPLDRTAATLTKLGPLRWQVAVVTDKLRKVAEVVGPGLVLPPEARSRVVEVLGSLAVGVPVRSALLQESDRAETLVAEARPLILLAPYGEGVSVEVHVRPLGLGTPLLRPAEGPVLVHARVEKRFLTAQREFRDELKLWAALLSRCPNLDAWSGGDWSLGVPDPLQALELLAELRDAGDAALVEWPQGGRIGLHRRIGTKSLTLKVTEDRQWFEIGGQAAVDNGRVVEFRELLSHGGLGRFIPLGDGDWVELEAQLLRQLEHLASVADPSAEGLRGNPLALASSELLLDETVTRASAEVERWRRRWKVGISPHLNPPSSLSADLRPYQLEGFRWLARLAEVGAGACLADDMGLGKTVQTIALLAHRASEGPSLVLAPTSVAPNWVAEILRFDRCLEPVLFSEGSRDGRHLRVSALGPGQVLVATYGLLVTEESLFSSRDWNVVVLDEAQAVKNVRARRSQAVLNLKAGFRVAATGTPLQNHLGELWSLFEFLNPGLLGTKTSFQDRFWGPIEATGDEGARRSLQALVRPFLLRRTKNQVLAELPEKTETSLAVTLSPEERAFYEALRAESLDRIAAADARNPTEARFLVLAQLMKLRRACCHPVLAGGPASPRSSKLEVLDDLLEGLIDNGHRVLVFSQFTDHLALIRARLEARSWAFEYLDGSTPSKERSARVARFQTGQAPVFLISLQAGGTGLNLTAADYVVHMDPWWNPAVEDQASDRAHRLGQTRPVTIYRLVAQDTIEQKIVDLHRTKRDLADALLEGTEAVGRMGPEELYGLIAGSAGAD